MIRPPGWGSVDGAWVEHNEMRVFNLDVEGFHTYYVGAMGLWVHGAHPLPADSTLKPI